MFKTADNLFLYWDYQRWDSMIGHYHFHILSNSLFTIRDFRLSSPYNWGLRRSATLQALVLEGQTITLSQKLCVKRYQPQQPNIQAKRIHYSSVLLNQCQFKIWLLTTSLNELQKWKMVESKLFPYLKPTGHVMHQQFNIQQLNVLPTLYLCVLYLSENKQRLVSLTA